MSSELIDITPLVSTRLQVFPGDTPPSREVLMDMASGDHVTVSTLRATVHLGAHVDAPSHYGLHGRTMAAQPLDLYVGPCQVMRVDVPPGETIGIAHLTGPIIQSRLLFATGSFPDPETWNEDFVAIDPPLVDHLADAGVRLVGIDTPSVDPSTSKTLAAHHRFLERDVAILEGIVLDSVRDGVYELIALPLKLEGFDGSPVRAILRPL